MLYAKTAQIKKVLKSNERIMINNPEPKVYILDDDEELLDAMKFALGEEGWSVKTFKNAFEFFDDAEVCAVVSSITYSPSCLVLDIQMPGMNGLEVQKKLEQIGGAIPIIFISSYGTLDSAIEAFRSGAFDFLKKPLDPKELYSAIEKAIKTDEKRLSQLFANSPAGRYKTLTEREKQVASDMFKGLSSPLIAEHLGVSERTLERYRQNVMKKLEISKNDFYSVYKQIISSKGKW